MDVEVVEVVEVVVVEVVEVEVEVVEVPNPPPLAVVEVGGRSVTEKWGWSPSPSSPLPSETGS